VFFGKIIVLSKTSQFLIINGKTTTYKTNTVIEWPIGLVKIALVTNKTHIKSVVVKYGVITWVTIKEN
jgi:hypothetical protein